MRALGALFVVTLGLGAGCATRGEIPIQQLTDSRATVLAAEEMGADRVDLAAHHLQLAREQTARGHQLLEEGEQRRAALLFERATADAELAIALAKEAPLRAEAHQLLQQVNAIQLREEAR